MQELVVSTLTGRNLGWLPNESETATPVIFAVSLKMMTEQVNWQKVLAAYRTQKSFQGFQNPESRCPKNT